MGLRVSADASRDAARDPRDRGVLALRELIQADRVTEHDRILVATSGHSAPDCAVEVIRIGHGDHPVLWIRLPDGRTSVYVPNRTVVRVAHPEG
jgi:hypothetical protein